MLKSWLLIIFLGLSGCLNSNRIGDLEYIDSGVTVETCDTTGRGVIIGPDEVLTIGHVIKKHTGCSVDGKPARVVKWIVDHQTETGEDGLVLLKTQDKIFGPERIAKISKRVTQGYIYLSQRGVELWPCGLRPGDSGSPILNDKGEVIGLVRAVYGQAEFLDQEVLNKNEKLNNMQK